MSKHKLSQLAAVFLPILVIAAWIGSTALHLSSGKTTRLKVVGFDPRDLLSGHYLRYQVDYGTSATTRCDTDEDWCLCLRPDEQGLSKIYQEGLCSVVPSCEIRLRGKCQNGQFIAGIERYYFSEEFRQELAIVPNNSSIDISLDSTGKAIVKEFYVDNKRLKDWLSDQAK